MFLYSLATCIIDWSLALVCHLTILEVLHTFLGRLEVAAGGFVKLFQENLDFYQESTFQNAIFKIIYSFLALNNICHCTIHITFLFLRLLEKTSNKCCIDLTNQNSAERSVLPSGSVLFCSSYEEVEGSATYVWANLCLTLQNLVRQSDRTGKNV